MKNVAIVPIRDDSTRLRQKATGIKIYKNCTPLYCMLERLTRSKLLDEIIFIVPNTLANYNLCEAIDWWKSFVNPDAGKKVRHFMGDEHDISGRALDAIDFMNHRLINVTGDCPLIDPVQIDGLLSRFITHKNRYPDKELLVSNVLTRSWPDGFDIQIFDSSLLAKSWTIALDKKVTTNLGWDIVNYSGYIQSDFEMYNFPAPEKYFYPDWGLTLDYKEDAWVLKDIYEFFDSFDFTAQQVIAYLKASPEVLEKNKNVRRKIPGC